jgi:hypothetical protein
MQDVQKLSAQEKEHVYAMLDAFLLKASIQKNLVTKKKETILKRGWPITIFTKTARIVRCRTL